MTNVQACKIQEEMARLDTRRAKLKARAESEQAKAAVRHPALKSVQTLFASDIDQNGSRVAGGPGVRDDGLGEKLAPASTTGLFSRFRGIQHSTCFAVETPLREVLSPDCRDRYGAAHDREIKR